LRELPLSKRKTKLSKLLARQAANRDGASFFMGPGIAREIDIVLWRRVAFAK
jgi:hypothetical protein